jgi:hypothetical protein
MSIQVETIGYKFRVSQGGNVFDVISTTKMGMTKSNDIIRAFFDNFKVLKTEMVVKPEEIMVSEDKTHINTGIGVTKVEEEPRAKPARKKREQTKNLWGNLRDLLSDEFTFGDYKKALVDAGYEYSKNSWATAPGVQLKKIVKLGKIEKIEGSEPVKYRKIKVPHSFRSDEMVDNTIKSLKEGKKAMMGTIR